MVSSSPVGTRLGSNPRSSFGSVVLRARGGNGVRNERESKRQARVAQLIRGEIAVMVRRGAVKTSSPLPDTLREKISIVDVSMSPDLRSAKIFVSVFGDAAEKRRAFAWLVEHSKPFKYALSQSLSDMKGVPEVHFKQTDIGAAVDVMTTIDRLASERSAGNEDGNDDQYPMGAPGGMIGGLDFDYDEDDFDYSK